MLQFLSSRASSPHPFKPKRSNTQNLEVGPGLGPIKDGMNGAPAAGPDVKEGSQVVAKLEAAAEGSANGHAK